MSMHRREFLKAGVAASVVAALPGAAGAQALFAPQPGAWRNFQIVTRLDLARTPGKTQAWIPLPSVNEQDWLRSLDSQWTTNGKATLTRDPKYGAGLLHVEWSDGESAPVVQVTSRIATRDRAIDLSKPLQVAALTDAERKLYTEGSDL